MRRFWLLGGMFLAPLVASLACYHLVTATATPIFHTYLPLLANASKVTPLYIYDDFSNPSSGWPSGDDGNIKRGYLDGEYQILVRQPGYVAVSALDASLVDFSAQVDARFNGGNTSTGDGLGIYGLAFDISDDWGSMYVVLVDPWDGLYSTYKVTNNTWTTFDNWSSDGVSGDGKTTIRVTRNGGRVDLWFNGAYRNGFTDSSLSAGRVGLVGGTFNNTTNADARFDNFTLQEVLPLPPTPTPIATWTLRAGMPTPRNEAGAAVGPNGKIYVIGGADGGNYALATNEEYDPATDTWTIRAPMPTPRCFPAVVTGPDGWIYAIGGSNTCYYNQQPILAPTTVEAYDPSTNQWISRASIPEGSYSVQAATIGGKIYVVGDQGIGNLIEAYDPATDSWTIPYRSPGYYSFGNLLATSADGRLITMGGAFGYNTPPLVSYDPATNAVASGTPPPFPVVDTTIVAASNGDVFMIGGSNLSAVSTDGKQVLEYSPKWDDWSTTMVGPLEVGMISPAAAATADGHLYVFGGNVPGTDTVLGSVESALLPQNTPLSARDHARIVSTAPPETTAKPDIPRPR